MKNMCGNFSVIVPAYNESETLPRCISSIYKICNSLGCEIIVVGDKKSLESISKFKNIVTFEYDGPMVSAVNLGVSQAKNDIIVKIDADISIKINDLVFLSKKMKDHDLVSCPASTRAKSFLINFLFIGRDVFQKFAPLGCSSHGNTLFFRKSDLSEFGGFHYDTKLHFFYAQNKKKILIINKFFAKEYRANYNIAFVKKRQIESGIKRHDLGVGFKRTFFHTIVRCRPFVIVGWLKKHWSIT